MRIDINMNQTASSPTRRAFLRKTAGAVASISIVPSYVVGLRAATPSPNNKLNIACIGVGGQGAADLGNVSSENIVALCDVDSKRAAASFAKFPDAKQNSIVEATIPTVDT